MKAIILSIVLMTTTTFSFAQTFAEWKGGTPGDENNWHNAKKWSNNRVPDEFTIVIIELPNTGHFAQPVIKEKVEVIGIEIYANANLTIETSGSVLIDGTDFYSEGIVNIGGKLTNKGLINLVNLEKYTYQSCKVIQGEGKW